MSFSIPKGVFDIFPTEPKAQDKWKEIHRYQHLEKILIDLSHRYGFEQVSTPIFEKTDLFSRGIGTGTDIVSKEMYTFEDKAGRSLTLRPEGTAPVMRAFLERNLQNESYCHKLYYLGPMFRYERQQAGRYRQFHQYGAEVIGLDSPKQDVEVIDLLCSFFQHLGLDNLTIHINSIGGKECRETYRAALVKALTPHKEKLSEESQKRLEVNPLRILDSKNKTDQALLKDAPSILDYLEEDARAHFEEVQKWLTLFKIPFVVSDKLVRGLDYYNNTVFEVVCGDLGAHDTLAAGGRYDYLTEDLGGPKLPAVGFAMGLERILQVMHAQKCSFTPRKVPQILLIPLGEIAKEVCFELVRQLRFHKIPAEMDFSDKKLKAIMKYADKREIPYISIIGEEELKAEQIKLKNMVSGHEETLPIDQLLLTLTNKLNHDA